MGIVISSVGQLSISSPETAFSTVFRAGIAASLSLGVVVRLPVVAAFVAGAGRSKKHAVLLSILFTVGLVVSTVLLGLTAVPTGDDGRQILYVNKALFQAFGFILLVVGFLVSGLINPQLLPARWRLVAGQLGKASLCGAFLLGGALGLMQTPVCQGCRATLLSIAEATAAQGGGLTLLVGFAAGQSVTVLAVGVLTSLIKPDLLTRLRTRLCSLEDRMQLLAGNMLIVLGIYFVIVA
jgi:cytochrome c biogenesis protein CcdA